MTDRAVFLYEELTRYLRDVRIGEFDVTVEHNVHGTVGVTIRIEGLFSEDFNG